MQTLSSLKESLLHLSSRTTLQSVKYLQIHIIEHLPGSILNLRSRSQSRPGLGWVWVSGFGFRSGFGVGEDQGLGFKDRWLGVWVWGEGLEV